MMQTADSLPTAVTRWTRHVLSQMRNLVQVSIGGENRELSLPMTIILMFVTHGLTNALLLSLSPVRCLIWNKVRCNDDEAWILNWLVFGLFHLHILIGCLAIKAEGQVILEQRLLNLITAIMLSFLSSGVFLLDYLEKTLAAVQLLVYAILLLAIAYHTATAPLAIPTPYQLRASSFDSRKQLPMATIALAFQFVQSAFQVWDMTFGHGRDNYLGDGTGEVYHCISCAAMTQMLWVAILLGGSVLLATVEQQKFLLLGETVALFVSLLLLVGHQGTMIKPAQVQAACIGTFFSMLIAVWGAL